MCQTLKSGLANLFMEYEISSSVVFSSFSLVGSIGGTSVITGTIER